MYNVGKSVRLTVTPYQSGGYILYKTEIQIYLVRIISIHLPQSKRARSKLIVK